MSTRRGFLRTLASLLGMGLAASSARAKQPRKVWVEFANEPWNAGLGTFTLIPYFSTGPVTLTVPGMPPQTKRFEPGQSSVSFTIDHSHG